MDRGRLLQAAVLRVTAGMGAGIGADPSSGGESNEATLTTDSRRHGEAKRCQKGISAGYVGRDCAQVQYRKEEGKATVDGGFLDNKEVRQSACH